MNAQTKITAGPAVYSAIAAVQGELAKVGIAKESENTSQNYKFRGIDAVYGALSPLLSKHGLCVLPRIVNREMHERVTIKEWNGQKKESVLFYVTVEAEFDFVSVEDGSAHTVRTYGEAMDSGDKATNKAMSAAYKYAAFMAFAIPTEGDNDADGATHDVAPKQADTKPNATYIADDQRDILMALAAAKGIDARTFCKVANVRSVNELPANEFEKAKDWIDKQKPRAKPAQGRAAEPMLDDEIPY